MAGISRTSPRVVAPSFLARMVAVFYLVLLLVSGFDMFFIFGKVVARNDAGATAANILAHQTAFLAGFASAAVGVAAYLVVTALFYRLFEPVSRTLSLCAAFFSLTGCVVQAWVGSRSCIRRSRALFLRTSCFPASEKSCWSYGSG
jgi:Domain of unknown function (DUF4386)